MNIDLRSDTVTRPTEPMLQTMFSAEVGDDVYKEDPSVNALETEVAELFGKEQALFFPSGSMANQAAIKLHTQPGDQLIAHQDAHVYLYEGGGVSFNSGVSCKLLSGPHGMITAEQVEQSINPPDFYHSPLTRLVCLENSTNKGGGACYGLDQIYRIKSVCDSHGLGLHLDGARLWNAAVATGIPLASFGPAFDTISVCLSKGLGAPMGSVLVGDSPLMDKAIRVRKVLGGAMRQLGYMAAAGSYALAHHRERLHEDHVRAQEIASALAACSYVIDVVTPQTNIVIFEPRIAADVMIQKFAKKGIHFYGMGPSKLRMVTHLDYTASMHEYTLDVIHAMDKESGNSKV